MLQQLLDTSPWILGPLTVVLVVLVQLVRSYARLSHIPGPFAHAWTDLPRLRWVASNRAHDHHIAAHRAHGPIVRFGPNMVSVADPAEISTIYRIADPFHKSDFYRVLSFFVGGRPVPGLFATQDEDAHRMLRRPIAGMYSMTNIVHYEPFVDSTIRTLFAQFDARFVRTGAVCKLDEWLEMFAFDVIGELTFSKRLGFLDEGRDIDGIMHNAWRYFKTQSVKTQMPWLDRLWTKNPVVQAVLAAVTKHRVNPIVQFAMDRRAERTKAVSDAPSSDRLDDFLTRFIQVQAASPSTPAWAVSAWATSNVTAGADTTAIMLRTIFHRLLSNPATLAKLRAELVDHEPGTILAWKDAHKLPYLDACIKEAGRLHPPFALPYERVVGPAGVRVCGQFLPPGTIVGMSAWAVHRSSDVFGEHVDEWRPERWLEADAATRRRMESSLLTFGAGHRSCIGKNLSHLEMYKLVPSVLLAFDLQFATEGCPEWRVENRWFANQFGLNVRVAKR